MPERADRSPAQRVVVTGAGMVTSLGPDLATTFEAMAAGRSGVTTLTRFDATGLPCDIGAQLDVEGLIPEHALDEVGGSELRLLRHATAQATTQADLAAFHDRRRIAVAIGGHGSTPSVRHIQRTVHHMDAADEVDAVALRDDPKWDRSNWTARSPETAPTLLAHHLDARGPVLPVVSACAAGTQAIGEGLRFLREGRADVVVAGGAEPLLNYSYFLGFAILGALTRRYPSPEKASRPFDRRRNGFVIGEGAAVLILETLEGARARGREILGEVLGYGDSADGYRITDMHPEADGAVLAMRAAIADAGLLPDDVDYVNAHGTSTPINDPTETLACKRVFGDRAYEVPISSNKSMIGHTIGAAGAIEGVLTLEGMRRGLMLPTINQEAPDRRCDLDYVPNEARASSHHVALSNSFGFGGQNACLALGSAESIS
ncbi:MAG: beta-ketoacyl-[acyl-carrier-protein] synthase family protein [Planctomycetota bacterium]|nr:beta-ketoacyl-[acyl-carrier-protein] synthase family protein [Planctomycetota bacterium]